MPTRDPSPQVPRDWALDPVLFGRPAVQWRDVAAGSGKTEALIQQSARRAARAQSGVVTLVRVRMVEHDVTGASTLARRSGIGESQISRLLSGAAWMSLRHMAALDIALGGDLLSEVLFGQRRAGPS